MRSRLLWWSLGIVVSTIGVRVSWGQDTSLQFFPCAEVRFFTPACLEPAEGEEAPAPPPPQALSPAGVPLFPPETLSPLTPPLLRQLLEQPTLENARAFVAWQRAQLARVQEVQVLLQQVQSEELAVPTP